jgi:hypothetical protein
MENESIIKILAFFLPLGLVLTFLGLILQTFFPFFIIILGLALAVLSGLFLLRIDKIGRDRTWFDIIAVLLSLCSVPISFQIMYQMGLLYFFDVITTSASWIFWGWIMIYGLISPVFLMNRSDSKIPNVTHQRNYNIANVAIVPMTTIFSSIIAFAIWNFCLRSVFGGHPGILEMVFGGGFLSLAIGLVVSFLAGLAAIFIFNPLEFIFARMFERERANVGKGIQSKNQKSKIPFFRSKSIDSNLTQQTSPKRLRPPRIITIIQLVFGLVVFGLIIYGVISLRDFVEQIAETFLSGNFNSLIAILRQTYSTATLLMTSIIGGVIIFFFLLIYGVYADMANRSGFPINSRKKFLISPFLFAIAVVAAAIPALILLTERLFSLNLEAIIVWFLPTIGAFLGILILAGALPLWFLHRKDATPVKATLFSARLIFSPVIDAFWSAVASFVGIVIASPILQIAAFVSILEIIHQFTSALNSNPLDSILKGFRNVFDYVISDSALLTYMIPFLIVGIVMAIFIYKKGVSETLSVFLGLMAFVMPISTIAFAYVISTYFGSFSWIYWIAIIIPLAIICVIYFIAYFASAFLTGAFRVSGVFGLVIIFISAMILLMFFGVIPNIPFFGKTIMEVISHIASWLPTVAAEIGIMGIIVGITIMILALKEREEKQVFNTAIAASIAGSTVLPFVLVWGLHLPGLLGGLLGSVLVFALISPIYLVSVTLLRLNLAIQTFIDPKKANDASKTNISNIETDAEKKSAQNNSEPWYGER